MTEPRPIAELSTEERNQWIEQYLPLVRHVVGRLVVDLPTGIDREDLVGHGILGLVRAVTNFDPRRGVTLKTFAYVQIRGAVLDELRRQDFLPRSARERVRLLERERARLEQELGRRPSLDELAQACALDTETLDETLLAERTGRTLSHARRFPDEGEASLVELMRGDVGDEPMERVLRQESVERLALAVAALPERERRVIVLYYAEGLLLRDIAEVLDVTESRVSQIHTRALARLHEKLRDLAPAECPDATEASEVSS